MKKFLLLNQDEEPMFDVQWREFNCAILELGGGYFVVNVVPKQFGQSYACAVYRSANEAAKAVDELNDFALKVSKPNQAFAFPVSEEEPISPLEILETIF